MSQEKILFSQKYTMSSNTTSAVANVKAQDFKNISLTIIATGVTTGFSIRVKGSIQFDTPPDFSIASSNGNEWSYIQLKNNLTSSYVDGDTGFTVSANGTYSFEINTSLLAFVALEMFSRTDGTCVGQFIFKNNV